MNEVRMNEVLVAIWCATAFILFTAMTIVIMVAIVWEPEFLGTAAGPAILGVTSMLLARRAARR